MTTPDDCPDCKPFEVIAEGLAGQLTYYAKQNQELKQKIRDLETEIALLKLQKDFFI